MAFTDFGVDSLVELIKSTAKCRRATGADLGRESRPLPPDGYELLDNRGYTLIHINAHNRVRRTRGRTRAELGDFDEYRSDKGGIGRA